MRVERWSDGELLIRIAPDAKPDDIWNTSASYTMPDAQAKSLADAIYSHLAELTAQPSALERLKEFFVDEGEQAHIETMEDGDYYVGIDGQGKSVCGCAETLEAAINAALDAVGE